MLCTNFPPFKTNDPNLWNWKAGNGCIALSTPSTFYEFSLSSCFRTKVRLVHSTTRPTPRSDVCPIPPENMGIELVAICTHYPRYSLNGCYNLKKEIKKVPRYFLCLLDPLRTDRVISVVFTTPRMPSSSN